ncbi:uncharacterized protein FIESC28_11673 [Fusarium coffeatum]|uniref:Knr4/Smi1-like domain-containing protein n=1 Tax=Fusarium coffeatum TaxID=231269 RepID=A0A366QGI4_9HYPO|nr:uncharacterized protein FIESC28_11673 [Fusarium coffeatum]RBR03852.1 hypothetical protein FIESC28_11673 [Fusarium coffeatum]
MSQSEPKKFDRITVLTNPSLKEVYDKLTDLAKEFAVLGEIETTRELISLLLRDTTSDWQRWQIKCFEPFFAVANRWPDEILEEDRSEKTSTKTTSEHSSTDENTSEETNDEQLFQEKIRQARDDSVPFGDGKRSAAAVDALCTALKLALKQSDDMQTIKDELKVQEALEIIGKNLHKSRMLSLLADRRELCELLSIGELARKVPIDKSKLEATTKKIIETFYERLNHGRQKHEIEYKPLKEVLLELERHTKTNAVDHWEEMEEPVPETLFVLPPATDEQILSLEKKLDVTLPDDYKEFLKISNGFGQTWNGYHLDNALYGVDEIDWADEDLEVPFVEFHDSISGVTELRITETSRPEWPSSGPTLEIGSYDVLSTLMIPPKGTKVILDAYQEALDDPKIPDDPKKQVLKSIEGRHGSLEEMMKLEWATIEQQDSDTLPCGTFRQCLEERLRRAKSGPYCYELEGELGGIAYHCRADGS